MIQFLRVKRGFKATKFSGRETGHSASFYRCKLLTRLQGISITSEGTCTEFGVAKASMKILV